MAPAISVRADSVMYCPGCSSPKVLADCAHARSGSPAKSHDLGLFLVAEGRGRGCSGGAAGPMFWCRGGHSPAAPGVVATVLHPIGAGSPWWMHLAGQSVTEGGFKQPQSGVWRDPCTRMRLIPANGGWQMAYARRSAGRAPGSAPRSTRMRPVSQTSRAVMATMLPRTSPAGMVALL